MIISKIKNVCGLCNYKGCKNKATVEIDLQIINKKRYVCDKHLEEFRKNVNNDIIVDERK